MPRDKNWETVWKLFKGRCLRCRRTGICIHEIIPRSQLGEQALEVWNRCVLCNRCHNWSHNVGSTTSIPLLQTLRKTYVDKLN